MAISTNEPEQCIARALDTHAQALRRFVAGRVPAAEVDDIMQIAALRALERADSLDDEARVRPWLFSIHRNLVTDTLRQLGRRERLHESMQVEPDASVPELEESCDCSSVQATRLRPSYAVVLDLIDASGVSVAEAADTLGISVNNTRVRLHRARKALRDAMREHCGVEEAADCMECRCIEDECCVT
jgi:RNA polymerase sigma-70 factor (ECF subfamily)